MGLTRVHSFLHSFFQRPLAELQLPASGCAMCRDEDNRRSHHFSVSQRQIKHNWPEPTGSHPTAVDGPRASLAEREVVGGLARHSTDFSV